MQRSQRFVADQRFDLPQYESMLGYITAEFNNYNREFFSEENKIVHGWIVENNGGLEIRISNAEDSLLMNSERPSFENIVYWATTDDLLTLELADNSTNYVEVQLVEKTCAPDTVAIWDPTANGGLGEEFTQTVDTAKAQSPVLVSNTIAFTGDPDKLPLAIVTTSGGVITNIDDARKIFYELEFDWDFDDGFGGRTDRLIKSLKNAYDALTTSMKELKGSVAWYDQPWGSAKILKEYQNMFISGGGSMLFEGTAGANTLQWTADLNIEIAGRADTYVIDATSVTLLDGQAVYVEIPEGTPPGSLTPIVANIEDVPLDPLDPAFDPGIHTLYFRRSGTVFGFMDIPELSSGETAVIGLDLPSDIRSRLGIIDDASFVPYTPDALAIGIIDVNDDYATAISKLAQNAGTIKIQYVDTTESTLPTGTAYSPDGTPVIDGDRVLFSDPALNAIYEVSGVGASLVWTPINYFEGSANPSAGDWVSIEKGTDYFKTHWRYRDATIGWRPMESADAESEPTGFRERTTSQISFDDGTRTFTIQPKAPNTYFDYWTQGKAYRKNGPVTVVIPDVEGNHFIYFDKETLVTSTVFTYDIIKEFAFVSSIQWDATNNTGILIGDERHGLTLDGATHRYLHNTVGTRWVSGLSLGNFVTGGTGAVDADVQMSLSDGLLFDEDIDLTPTDSPTPTEDFEQILDPIAEIPVFYRDGASGDWRKDAALTYPLKVGTLPKWNDPSGPWTQPDATDNNFIAMWLYATNSITEPIIAIMGQNEDTSLTNAQANNTPESLSLGTLPSLEFKLLYRLIFEVDSTYANTSKASLRDVIDLRASSDVAQAAFSPNDHGLLSGLTDPDHPATAVFNDTSGFDGGLSASDVLVQDSLDTLNARLGQLRILPHATITDRVVITGAERILNSGITISQELRNLLLKFDGAEIEFSTGSIFESDGTTPLNAGANDFTPVVIPSSEYQFYSIQIIPGVSNANNTINGGVLVIPAAGSDAVLADAPRAAFGNNVVKLGEVYVQESGGGVAAIAAANIFQLGIGSGSGGAGIDEAALFQEDLKARLRRGFLDWFTPNIIPIHGEDRIDPSSTGEFDIANNLYELESTAAPYVPIQQLTDPGNTGDTNVSGPQIAAQTFTAVTSFEPTTIELDLRQVGTPTGNLRLQIWGTNGSNEPDITNVIGISDPLDVTTFETALGGDKETFTFSTPFTLNAGTLYAMVLDGPTDLSTGQIQIGGESSSVYAGGQFAESPTGAAASWNLTNLDIYFDIQGNSVGSGEFMLSDQSYGCGFMESDRESRQVEVHVLYDLDNLDENPTVEVAQDAVNFYPVTMDRIGKSGKYRGVYIFPEPATTVQADFDVSNANATKVLDATASQSYAVKLPTVASGVKQRITDGTIHINKLGAPLGSLFARIVEDDTGVPGSTIIGESQLINIDSDLAVGDNAVAVDVDGILPEGDYWLVLTTGDDYKNSGFNSGVDEVAVRIDNSSPAYSEGDSYEFDGATWTIDTGSAAVFELQGFLYDLRVKVTASQDSKLIGTGIFFGESGPSTYDSKVGVERIDFSGDLDQTVFTVSNFLPDPTKLKVYDVNTGQVWRFPAFATDGFKVVFASGTFSAPGETITLIFDNEGGGFDNNDANAALLAANRLGSTDPTLDKSIAGEGILQRADNGTLVEASLREISPGSGTYEWTFAEAP